MTRGRQMTLLSSRRAGGNVQGIRLVSLMSMPGKVVE